ncbi:MAG TPA: hypothetical protein VG297_07310, partial [Bryobacteraceae bacterium]|jgi:hypothetical protein|nr:hypothetical protein [Bryobacteraceae bacterium]
VLGLAHNPDESSVMFSFGLDDKSAWLDAADLDALAARHSLRPEIRWLRGKMNVMVSLPQRFVAHAPRVTQSTP